MTVPLYDKQRGITISVCTFHKRRKCLNSLFSYTSEVPSTKIPYINLTEKQDAAKAVLKQIFLALVINS